MVSLFRFIYNEIRKIKNNKNFKSEVLEIFQEDSETLKFKMRKDLKIYLFSSHTPCN